MHFADNIGSTLQNSGSSSLNASQRIHNPRHLDTGISKTKKKNQGGDILSIFQITLVFSWMGKLTLFQSCGDGKIREENVLMDR